MDITDKIKAELGQSILTKLRDGSKLTEAERKEVLRIVEAYLNDKRGASVGSDPRRTRPL